MTLDSLIVGKVRFQNWEGVNGRVMGRVVFLGKVSEGGRDRVAVVL